MVGGVPQINIFDNTFENIHIAMSNSTRKQAILAHNIANIDTPDFEALDFDDVLGRAVKRKEGGVVLEKELAALTENSIKYSALVKLLSSKINIMRTIATQGRR